MTALHKAAQSRADGSLSFSRACFTEAPLKGRCGHRILAQQRACASNRSRSVMLAVFDTAQAHRMLM